MADNYELDTLPKGFILLYGIAEDEDPPTHGQAVLRKAKLPMAKRGMADANDLQDDTDEKVKAPGFYEEETLAFTTRFRGGEDGHGYDELRQLFLDGLNVQWIVAFPLLANQATKALFTFSGFIEELGIPEFSAGQDDRLDVTFSVKASNIDFTKAT